MRLPANSFLVYQAYGDKGILQECVFSLLTLCRQHPKEILDTLEVWIYTDQPEFFRSFRDCSLQLRFRKLDHEQITAWKGTIDFVHRVKIEILREFTKEREGQVLYLDTDTYFTQPIDPILNRISKGELYMHIMEGLVHESDNVILGKLSKFIKKNNPLKVNGNQLNIAEDTAMWNAGVLGFHTRYRSLLDEVLIFTDEIYQQFHKHVVEQFAFSWYFQNAGALKTAHTNIFHYWNLKEIRLIFNSFFTYFEDSTWEDLVRYSVLVQLPEPMQQKVNFLQNRTPLEKFQKKHWKPQEPRWDLLVRQL